jgi:hypothetical protein
MVGPRMNDSTNKIKFRHGLFQDILLTPALKQTAKTSVSTVGFLVEIKTWDPPNTSANHTNQEIKFTFITFNKGNCFVRLTDVRGGRKCFNIITLRGPKGKNDERFV